MFVQEEDQQKHVTQDNTAGFCHRKGPWDSGNAVGGQKHVSVCTLDTSDSRMLSVCAIPVQKYVRQRWVRPHVWDALMHEDHHK